MATVMVRVGFRLCDLWLSRKSVIPLLPARARLRLSVKIRAKIRARVANVANSSRKG